MVGKESKERSIAITVDLPTTNAVRVRVSASACRYTREA